MMHKLHVDVGQATFYQETSKLRCQATVGAGLSTEDPDLSQRTSIPADSLSSCTICYRVSRPLLAIFDLSFDDSLRWQLDEGGTIRESLAEALSSAQFWAQLDLTVVSIDIPFDLNSQTPFHIRILLRLEHTGSIRTSKSPDEALGLDVNDLNYPNSLPRATVENISLALSFEATTKKGRATRGDQDKSLNAGLEACTFSSETVQIGHVVSLTDAALRCSISPGRQRLTAGVKRRHSNFEHTIQSLFPAIFSPSGFRFIAARKSFITGISRSLSSCLTRAHGSGLEDGHCSHQAQQQRRNHQFQSDILQNATFDDSGSLLWGNLLHSTQDFQQKIALEPLMVSENLSRKKSGMLSDPLTNPGAKFNFNQLEHAFGATLCDILPANTCKSYHEDAEAQDWLEDEPALNVLCSSILTHQDQEQTLYEDLFQASVSDEKFIGVLFDEEDDEIIEEAQFCSPACTSLGSLHLSRACALCRLSGKHEGRSKSEDDDDVSMLMEDRVCLSLTRHEAYNNSERWVLDDLIGGAQQLSQNDIRINPSKRKLTNSECASAKSYHAACNAIGRNEPDERFTQERYLFNNYPSPDTNLLPDFFRCTISTTLSAISPSSDRFLTTNQPMPSFRDLHHQTSTQQPIDGPSLSDLLGDDKGLWSMWQRRGSVGLSSGSMRSMKLTNGHYKRSPSSESMDSPQNESVQPPTTADTKDAQKPFRRSSLIHRSSTTSSASSASSASSSPEKRHSLLRRLSKSSRASSNQEMLDFDFSRTQDREVEIKRRKTLQDYDADDEMLFE